MTFIFNISIVIPVSRKHSFISWANGEGRLAAASPLLRDYRCLMVAGIPGDKEFEKSPDATFSLQMQFDSLKDCREWHRAAFETLMQSYSGWHGPNPLFFSTILKEV